MLPFRDPLAIVPAVTSAPLLLLAAAVILAMVVVVLARRPRRPIAHIPTDRELDEGVLALVMAEPGSSLRGLARDLGVQVDRVKATVERLVDAGILGVREEAGELRFAVPGGADPEPPAPEPLAITEPLRAVSLVDVVLPDGVPRGSTVLVVGRSGAGMELLLKDLAVAAAPATIFTANESPADVEDQLRARDEGAEVHVEDLAARVAKGTDESDRDTIPVLAELTAGASDPEAPVVVLDSLDVVFEHHPLEAVVRGTRALVLATRSGRGAVVLGLTRGTVPDEVESQLASMADVVLELEVERWSPEPEWVLHLRKVRNAPEGLRSVPYRPDRDGHLVLAGRNRVRSARWTRG